MKKHVVKALQWALSKFDDKPALVESWPFPVGHEPKLVSKKPTLKKATTRKVVAKKVVKAKKK
jgi:hypothetical protein